MTEKTTIICDECGKEIITDKGQYKTYVNAGSYGVHFHVECFNKMTALEVVRALNLDDIKLMNQFNWDTATRMVSKTGKVIS